MPRNPYICLTIVATLGATMLIGVIGMLLLALYGRDAPASLVAVVSGAAGSLSSFLVSVPRGSAGGEGNNPGAKPPPSQVP